MCGANAHPVCPRACSHERGSQTDNTADDADRIGQVRREEKDPRNVARRDMWASREVVNRVAGALACGGFEGGASHYRLYGITVLQGGCIFSTPLVSLALFLHMSRCLLALPCLPQGLDFLVLGRSHLPNEQVFRANQDVNIDFLFELRYRHLPYGYLRILFLLIHRVEV